MSTTREERKGSVTLAFEQHQSRHALRTHAKHVAHTMCGTSPLTHSVAFVRVVASI